MGAVLSPAAPAQPGSGWASAPTTGEQALGRRCRTLQRLLPSNLLVLCSQISEAAVAGAGHGSRQQAGKAALPCSYGCPWRCTGWAAPGPWGSTGAARSLEGLGQLPEELLCTGDRARLELVGNTRLFSKGPGLRLI